jgi:predicted dehydrogenase
MPVRSSPSPAISRRGFLAGAAAASLLGALPAAAAEAPAPQAEPPKITPKVKLGVVGCGGRGAWIARLFQQHGGYELHAVADYFQDAADACGDALGVDKARRFTGLSGYKKVIDAGAEAVVVIDVPCFYAEQAKAAVEAGRHVYMAKPIAADVPGCLQIEALGKQATAKRLAFLVDYQLPTEQANVEVAARIREGALGPLAHVVSFGLSGAWADPPKGPTIEDRLRGEIWLSDVALGGDNIVSYDIHIIDGVVWVMGKRPVSACGRSRTCRADPHGDRTDCGGVVYEFDDGVLWTHLVHALNNNADITTLSASFFGLAATGRIQYGGKVYVRGGSKHYVGECGSIYDQGAIKNIAAFYRAIVDGRFENETVRRAVDGTLTAILGREASARRCFLTMDDLVKENRRLAVDLAGLKA